MGQTRLKKSFERLARDSQQFTTSDGLTETLLETLPHLKSSSGFLILISKASHFLSFLTFKASEWASHRGWLQFEFLLQTDNVAAADWWGLIFSLSSRQWTVSTSQRSSSYERRGPTDVCGRQQAMCSSVHIHTEHNRNLYGKPSTFWLLTSLMETQTRQKIISAQ